MSEVKPQVSSWLETLRSWSHPSVITMFFLGFSAGLPILLIFSTLSVWLREAGVSRSAVTFFSWAALGYSFKFIWAPLIDKLPLPFLAKSLGRRRSWLLVAQFAVIAAMVWMASTDPLKSESSMTIMALAAVFLGFSSATQDIVIDAYRIECVDESMQALLASTYVAGYRVGMLAAGAGSLYLAAIFGTSRELYDYSAWRLTYLCMAALMSIGVVTTMLIREPVMNKGKSLYSYSTTQYVRFLFLFLFVAGSFACTFFFSASLIQMIKEQLGQSLGLHARLSGFFLESLRLAAGICIAGLAATIAIRFGLADRDMVEETYVLPVQDFFKRYHLKTAMLILLLVGFYRVSDIVLGVVSNVFYLDMGFTKNVIATVTKTFGLIMTLVGGFLGGMMTIRFGVRKILFLGAVLAAATNLLFMALASVGPDITFLTLVIAADNLCAGLASTAFIAYLSSLTSISFTAVQYALFSSLMTLFPKLFGGYSGTVVAAWGYENFFLLTALMGIPVLFLVWLVRDDK